MSERKKFVILVVLLALSIALLVYVRSNMGEDFVQNL